MTAGTRQDRKPQSTMDEYDLELLILLLHLLNARIVYVYHVIPGSCYARDQAQVLMHARQTLLTIKLYPLFFVLIFFKNENPSCILIFDDLTTVVYY